MFFHQALSLLDLLLLVPLLVRLRVVSCLLRLVAPIPYFLVFLSSTGLVLRLSPGEVSLIWLFLGGLLWGIFPRLAKHICEAKLTHPVAVRNLALSARDL